MILLVRPECIFYVKNQKELNMFKIFKARVEKEICTCLSYLRTNKGREFLSKEFDDFCQSEGIHIQLTTSYIPQ